MTNVILHALSTASSASSSQARTGHWAITRRALAVAMLFALAPAAHATETLTYKGSLRDGGKVANGNYDIQVQLFAAEFGGTPVTSLITLSQVRVTDGNFDVPVDLPGKLPANTSVWLQAEVKPTGSADFYPLGGRQEIDTALGSTCWETTGNPTEAGGTVGIPGASSAAAPLLVLSNRGSNLYLRSTGGFEQSFSSAVGVNSVALNSDSQAYGPNSFTAGKGATASTHSYSVVFADGQAPAFQSTALNQFLVRAQNGVGINTNAPRGPLSVQRGGVSGAGGVSPSAITSESDTNLYTTMLTPSTQERGILFGDEVNTSKGGIIFNPVGSGITNQDGLTFRTGGNQDRLKITSSGILLLNIQGDPPEADVSLRSAVGGNTDFFMNLRSESNNLGRLSVANGASAEFRITAQTGDLVLFSNQVGKSVRTSVTPFGVNRTPLTNAFEVEGNASKTTAGSWLANSDRRIKTDVAPISDALSLINRVEPVTFHYNKTYIGEHNTIADQRYYNVIAQDFAKVFPTAVKGSGEYLAGMAKTPENEILQVDTYPATITSIAAIQELDAKASLQNDRVEKLEAENLALRDRLAALEKALLGRSVDEKR